jgi:hypothetical protein
VLDYFQSVQHQHLEIKTAGGETFLLRQNGNRTSTVHLFVDKSSAVTDQYLDISSHPEYQKFPQIVGAKLAQNYIIGNDQPLVIEGGDLNDYIEGGDGDDVIKGGGKICVRLVVRVD